MTAFWIAACALVALSWVMVSIPLWNAGASAVKDADPSGRSVTPSRRLRIGLGFGIAMFAFGVYGFLGNLDAIRTGAEPVAALSPNRPATRNDVAAEPTSEAVQSMLDAMVGRMQAQPPGTVDAAGWTLVARSYASIQQYETASKAYALAIGLAPADPALRDEAAKVQVALATAEGPARFAPVVKGSISISPELAANVRPTDTVFVFAREAGGTGMPIAAVRYVAGSFPLQFTLDESAPMNGSRKLSEVRSLLITARISRSGDALPRSGDMRGDSAPVGPDRDNVQIRIASVQP